MKKTVCNTVKLTIIVSNYNHELKIKYYTLSSSLSLSNRSPLVTWNTCWQTWSWSRKEGRPRPPHPSSWTEPLVSCWTRHPRAHWEGALGLGETGESREGGSCWGTMDLFWSTRSGPASGRLWGEECRDWRSGRKHWRGRVCPAVLPAVSFTVSLNLQCVLQYVLECVSCSMLACCAVHPAPWDTAYSAAWREVFYRWYCSVGGNLSVCSAMFLAVGPCGEEAEDQMVSWAHLTLNLG